MRIIKKGNEDTKTTLFTCSKCGCEFECTEDEYWEETSFTSVSYPPSHRVFANCPSCHKVCTNVKRDHINDYKITLTGDMVEGTNLCK